ncbi:MAG: DUF456 family protein [Haloarculaceae archaeon]
MTVESLAAVFPILQSGGLVLGLDLLAILALALVAGGVAGSVVPFVPGGILSLAGVFLYWWHTGYTDPGPLLLAGLVVLGLTVVAVDWLAGAISAKAGGASTRTVVISSVVGLAGTLVAGPFGFLGGTAGAVFLLELSGGGTAVASARTAGVTLLGMVTSNVLQVVLTAGMFCIMLVVVLL